MSRKFADILKEAKARETRRGVSLEPYKMTLDDGTIITVPAPDAQTYLALGEVDQNNILAQFRVLFNNNTRDFYRLLEEFKGAPAGVLPLLLTEMQEFWDQGDDLQPGKSEK